MEKDKNTLKKPPKKDKPPYAGKKHFFFLNPYEDCVFSRCPKCENKTKQRNFTLVIHIDPQQPFVLNEICRYCPHCDLIIAEKNKMESLIGAYLKKSKPETVENKFVVFGTVENADWREISKGEFTPLELMQCTYVFKDEWKFEPVPKEWYPPDEG